MPDYLRTRLQSLSIRGYRSIELVELHDLPDLVVLHGKNGSGKSNLMRAIRLALRVMGLPGDLPGERASARSFSLEDARQLLHLRPEDFLRGGTREIRIRLGLGLGTRARETIGPLEESIQSLSFEVVLQNTDDKAIKLWLDLADAGGKAFVPEDIARLQTNRLPLALTRERSALRQLEQQRLLMKTEVFDELSIQMTNALQAASAEVQRLQGLLGIDILIGERICQKFLAQQFVQLSDAERRVRDESAQSSGDFPKRETPESDEEVAVNLQYYLYLASTSEDEALRRSVGLLGRRLGEAGLFGEGKEDRVPVRLQPIRHRTFQEYQLLLSHPLHGDLPLRSLSSGEQQLVLLLSQQVITPWPVAFVEEPEAHLHASLMLKLARALRQSVEGSPPDVDQLWIATHHHAFAVASHYYDVRLDERGRTLVEKRSREQALEHFYEPGPFWDALKKLMDSGMKDEAVIFRNRQGKQVTAREIRDSLEGDDSVAREFVEFAMKQLVATLHKTKGPTGG